MRKHLLILLISVLTTFGAFAQVTTGSITGTVRDAKGATLPGATIVATHVPSGSVYSTTTGTTGKYTLPNMRVGGPYTIKITFIGFTPRVITDIALNLGDPLKIDVKLLDASQTLATVNVTGNKNALISPDRTGASTHIGQRQLTELPTVTRSLQDFSRLTPQAISNSNGTDGTSLGITFAGQNPRFNQFTIDGANATDAFGLASSGTNGGQAGINPVPLESIQDVQILLSPYDVTQGGFTGGGINAVTKSGTNEIHGSAYYFYQNQDFFGKSPTTGLKASTFKNKTFGASLSGPIIKNKLFYYVNYERFDNITPLAFDPSQSGSGSNFSTATLQGIHDFVLNKYGYDMGGFTDINKSIYSNSVFARLDWNINAKNKLTLRHSYVDGNNYIISRTANSMTFADGGYNFKSTTNSTVLELNSTISSRSSNVLRLTYNNVNDRRTTSPFPNVAITQNGLSYNFGAEFSSSANALAQSNYTLVDNYTIYKDNHTITFGTDNEFFNTSNLFQQAYNGAYTYNVSTSGYDNIAHFEANDVAPSAYTLNYVPTDPGAKFYAKMHAAQLGIYGQDVWSINSQLKLTYGLRVDLPVYFNKPTENAAFNSVYPDSKNTATPKSALLFAPRVGFNYDVKGDGETQLRGGAGIFTGRTPFVWVSNSYTNNGINAVKYTTVPSTLRFPADQAAVNGPLSGAFVPASATFPATEIDVTDKNFKVPQTFRANLAVDQKLNVWGLIGTLEGIFTKNINAISYQNLSIGPQTDVVSIGSSTRPWYNFARVNTAPYTDVLEVTNTSAGYAYNLTAQIQKPFEKGWTGMVSYTFGESFSVNDGTSSTAISNWRFVNNVNGLNNPDEARSNYDPGSRVVAYVGKQFRYAHNKLATTVGVVYTGQSGQPFSYTYSKNISGDDVTGKTGSNNADLIYVPSQAELNDPAGYLNYKFVDLTATSGGVTTIVRTAAQEWNDFKNFIGSQQGLVKNYGQVAPRNDDRSPWENHFDLKLTQDFYLYKMHKLSISADVLNIGNMLNKNWGLSYYVSNQTLSALTVVAQPVSTTVGGVTTTSKPTFTFDQTKMGIDQNGTYRPYTISDFNSRWRAQFSVRYSF